MTCVILNAEVPIGTSNKCMSESLFSVNEHIRALLIPKIMQLDAVIKTVIPALKCLFLNMRHPVT